MKSFCQIGLVMALMLFLVGCATHRPPICQKISINEKILNNALQQAQLGEEQEEKELNTTNTYTVYTVKPVREFKNKSGQICREYAAVIVNSCGERREMTGKSCQQANGSWQTVN